MNYMNGKLRGEYTIIKKAVMSIHSLLIYLKFFLLKQFFVICFKRFPVNKIE